MLSQQIIATLISYIVHLSIPITRKLQMESILAKLESIQQIIAIVGCQRSGTTLTGQILGTYLNAVLIDEPDGLYPWFHAVAENNYDARNLTNIMLSRAVKKYSAPLSRFILSGNNFTLKPNVRVIILKAPNLSYDWQKLSAFPIPVSIVYPVRDPRAVVASMANLSHIDFVGNQKRLIEKHHAIKKEFHKELKMIADKSLPLWKRRTLVWKIKTGLAPKFHQMGLSVHQFRYEDLVQSPKKIIENISSFCFGDRSLLHNTNNTYIGFGPGGTDRTRPIDYSSLVTWKTTLSDEQEADILQAAKPLIERFNYA